MFIWGTLSWTLLPWHNAVANKFTDEDSVSQLLKQNATDAGVYYLPFSEEDHQPGKAAAFINVLPNGYDMDMGKLMGTAMFGQLVAAFLVLLLLRSTTGLTYWCRVFFVTLVGLIIGFASHFPYWNWFGFSTSYVVVAVVDSTIAWFLAGLIMAKFVLGKTE